MSKANANLVWVGILDYISWKGGGGVECEKKEVLIIIIGITVPWKNVSENERCHYNHLLSFKLSF